MLKKHSYEYIHNYFKSNNCELLSKTYINSSTKLEYICECGNTAYIAFSNFVNGKRCKECGIKKYSNKLKLSQIEVNKLFEERGWKNTSLYKNAKQKLNVICNKGHNTTTTISNFKSKHGCIICQYENITGENHPNWNPNKSINLRLRISRKYSWIKNNMQHDINYDDYVNNPKKYHLDHIIPISIFSKLILHYKLDEKIIKCIINKKDNLQLLESKENLSKSSTGCIYKATQYLMLNNIKLINI